MSALVSVAVAAVLAAAVYSLVEDLADDVLARATPERAPRPGAPPPLPDDPDLRACAALAVRALLVSLDLPVQTDAR